MALTTTANVKAYLGITVSTYDTLIDRLVLAAQAEIERFCGLAFDSASHTEYFDGNRKPSVVLTNTPVTAVASVSYRKDNDEWTAYDATTYDWDADTGILELLSTAELWIAGADGLARRGFPKGNKAVRVAYTGGYSSIPADLQQACIELVAYMYGGSASARQARASGLVSESLGYESRSWAQMHAAQRFDLLTTLVGSYRRVPV